MSVVTFLRKYRQQVGRYAKTPDKKRIKEWYEKFKEGDLKKKKKARNEVF
jgi:hypothetical protein